MDITVLGFVASFMHRNDYFLLHVANGEIEDTLHSVKDFLAKPPISGYYKVSTITSAFSIYYDNVVCINAVIPDKFFSM